MLPHPLFNLTTSSISFISYVYLQNTKHLGEEIKIFAMYLKQQKADKGKNIRKKE